LEPFHAIENVPNLQRLFIALSIDKECTFYQPCSARFARPGIKATKAKLFIWLT
jgi:hypothetical protein